MARGVRRCDGLRARGCAAVTMMIVEWTPAPRGIPTATERLAMVLRLLDRDKVAEVAIYAHGTAAIRSAGGLLAIDDLMRSYDRPFEGAGSPLGDVSPVCLDDGSVLYGWEFVGTGQGGALSVLTASELDPHLSPPSVGGWAADRWMRVGLWAREQRTLDARRLERVTHWSAS